jgi:hypothetical protein
MKLVNCGEVGRHVEADGLLRRLVSVFELVQSE